MDIFNRGMMRYEVVVLILLAGFCSVGFGAGGGALWARI